MKIGLVFEGGGGKGAYEIGVWKALNELGIDKLISCVSGTSVGALNSILFLQGDYNVAEEVWLSLTMDKIAPVDNRELTMKGFALFMGNKNLNFIKKLSPKLLKEGKISREGLLQIIDKYIDFKKVIESEISCYATCTEFPELKARYFKINEHDEESIRDILLATSALPMFYESTEVETKKYMDGGIVDNLPIQPIYGEACDIIIVVHLSDEIVVDKSLYPNTDIIEVIPTHNQGGVLDGILDFTTEGAKRRILDGYEDTINMIRPIFNIHKYMMEREEKGLGINIGKILNALKYK